jgi:hypothetical protein
MSNSNRKAIYIFHSITQWNNRIMGIVADSVVEAVGYAPQDVKIADCNNYTLVSDDVEKGIRFNIEIENPDYEG